jgi:hypothetical protein
MDTVGLAPASWRQQSVAEGGSKTMPQQISESFSQAEARPEDTKMTCPPNQSRRNVRPGRSSRHKCRQKEVVSERHAAPQRLLFGDIHAWQLDPSLTLCLD